MRLLAKVVLVFLPVLAACGRGGESLTSTPAFAGDSAALYSDSAVARYCERTKDIIDERSIYRRYIGASENVKFFASRGMAGELGLNYEVLGNVMTELEDTARALEYYRRAEQCFREAGDTHLLYENMLHRTNVIPKSESSRIFSALLADSFVRATPALYANMLHGAYFDSNSEALLDSCLDFLKRNPSLEFSERASLHASKANEYTLRGENDSALMLLPAIKEECRKSNPLTRHREFIHTVMAQTYFFSGMLDSCVEELIQVVWWTDSAYREANMPAIYADESRKLIALTETRAELEKREMLLWLSLIILGLALGGVLLYFNARRRQEAARREIELLDSRLEGVAQSHKAQAAVLDEYQGLVNELRDAIVRSGSNAGVGDGLLGRELQRILSVHDSSDVNRKSFLAVSRELNPHFISGLKADFPMLSEGQLRLAALIAAGVDNHRLCAILNISSKSLYTARYRLRTQLGLSKTDSLEDLLRKYSSAKPE